jgi:ABC-type multidrug transport system fused ATPase/permease subunit
MMAYLIFVNVVTIAFEAASVAMLLPIFQVLQAGDGANIATMTGRHWDIIGKASAITGIPVTLGSLLITTFVFICLRQLCIYWNVYAYGDVRRQLSDSIRRRAFMGFLKAETALQDGSRISELASGLTVELDRALQPLTFTLRLAGSLLQMAVYVGGLFLLSAEMTLLCIVLAGIALFFLKDLMRSIKKTGARITKSNRELTAFIMERLRHTRLIRLSCTERAEGQAFVAVSGRHADQYLNETMNGARLTLLPEPLAIGFGFVVLYVGSQILGIGIDRLGLFVIVLTRLTPIVRSILTSYAGIAGRWPSAVRLQKLLNDIRQAQDPKGGSRVFGRLESEILYRNVSFSYQTGDQPALRDVTVAMPAHCMTALVGPSGSGKSTFIDLLPRLRDPSSGEILLDGVPLTQFSVASLRNGIAFVPQQPQIFNDTAAEHIRYGRDDATDEEVREAARLAGALDFIEQLPEGFHTLLGDGGARLSGGQRQRLDIARALVRRAPILILDEPTSALDAEAEAAFRGTLRTLRTETELTILVIAHRLSTIADADRIVLLQQGRMAAAGTHDELLAKGGWYAEAYSMQVDARPARTAQIPA